VAASLTHVTVEQRHRQSGLLLAAQPLALPLHHPQRLAPAVRAKHLIPGRAGSARTSQRQQAMHHPLFINDDYYKKIYESY
jgi:hypothetical protein